LLEDDDNGGKQADVADTTEKFCTKMCVFSACSALKLSTICTLCGLVVGI
jgi:hypothetical protein